MLCSFTKITDQQPCNVWNLALLCTISYCFWDKRHVTLKIMCLHFQTLSFLFWCIYKVFKIKLWYNDGSFDTSWNRNEIFALYIFNNFLDKCKYMYFWIFQRIWNFRKFLTILEFVKKLCCGHWQCMWSTISVCFALSLIVSEISAYFYFCGHVTLNYLNLENLKKKRTSISNYTLIFPSIRLYLFNTVSKFF